MSATVIPAWRFPRLHFENGTLEALKWLALVCMVVDHVNQIVLDNTLGEWSQVVGRLAFPIFAVVFGYNLARPGLDYLAIAKRLLWVAVLVSPIYALVLAPWPVNVLFTLGAVPLVLACWERDMRWLAVCLALGAGAYVDYLWPGLALVFAAFWYARRPRLGPLLLAVGSLVWIGQLLGNQYALLVLPLLIAATQLRVTVPRQGRFFLWFYAGHLAALGLLAGMIR